MAAAGDEQTMYQRHVIQWVCGNSDEQQCWRYCWCMREHLVPTRVINKNGVATTVHKKPANGKPVKGLPAPVAVMTPVPLSRQDLIESLIEPVAEYNKATYFKHQLAELPEQLKKKLNTYSTPLLERLYSAFNDPEFSAGPTGGSAKVIANFIDSEEDETFISDCLVFMPYIRTTSLIRGMRDYSATCSLPVDGSIGEGKLRDGLIAIMETVHFAQSHLEQHQVLNGDQLEKRKPGPMKVAYFVLKDERIIDLLLDRPEVSPRVRSSIAIRSSIDYDVIVEYIDGNALRDGTL